MSMKHAWRRASILARPLRRSMGGWIDRQVTPVGTWLAGRTPPVTTLPRPAGRNRPVVPPHATLGGSGGSSSSVTITSPPPPSQKLPAASASN
jgi:hypothetical protein